MTKSQTKKNERVKDGVHETQVGPFWIEVGKVHMFRLKCAHDDVFQRDAMDQLIDAYLEGKIDLKKPE